MATPCDLSIYQGDDWAGLVTVSNPDLSPADLTGYTAQAQIRTGPADQDPLVAAELSCTVQVPNQVLLYLSNAQTGAFDGAQQYYWDLQLISATSQITTILFGEVILQQEVTREIATPSMRVGVRSGYGRRPVLRDATRG
jgi:hypothetical protein